MEQLQVEKIIASLAAVIEEARLAGAPALARAISRYTALALALHGVIEDCPSLIPSLESGDFSPIDIKALIWKGQLRLVPKTNEQYGHESTAMGVTA